MHTTTEGYCSWAEYLARGVKYVPNSNTCDDVDNRSSFLYDKLYELFSEKLCLTPFSRNMAIEYVKASH